MFNHFATKKDRLTKYVSGDFFEAYSKAIFGEDMKFHDASYPLPENLALLLSRTHLVHKFEWATDFSPPGKLSDRITNK